MLVYASAFGNEQHVKVSCEQQEEQNGNGNVIDVFVARFFLEQLSKAE